MAHADVQRLAQAIPGRAVPESLLHRWQDICRLVTVLGPDKRQQCRWTVSTASAFLQRVGRGAEQKAHDSAFAEAMKEFKVENLDELACQFRKLYADLDKGAADAASARVNNRTLSSA